MPHVPAGQAGDENQETDEVTPAMILSGLRALDSARDSADERELVIAVYTAMAAARPL